MRGAEGGGGMKRVTGSTYAAAGICAWAVGEKQWLVACNDIFSWHCICEFVRGWGALR